MGGYEDAMVVKKQTERSARQPKGAAAALTEEVTFGEQLPGLDLGRDRCMRG